ncbi:MAG: peptide chain release factor N(5)-glutamine methyltransferase [Planctomycetes bacterium]|nr:peptide chain release factor N(5)-glutamine methyltransferase [Planctomycetota bacterium]
MQSETEWTVGALLDWTAQHFVKKGCDSPRLDAEVLLAHALRLKRIDLYARYNEVIQEEARAIFRDLVRRRGDGCPVAYLVASKEFYSLPFFVNQDVLIPRPDTECLVDVALRIGKKENWKTILDLGTGSGCIAIALAKSLPQVKVVALDISAKALEIASRNAIANKVADRVSFVQGDLFAPLEKGLMFDAIVSNPPYIPDRDINELDKDVRDYEPRLALSGGGDGFSVFDRILSGQGQSLV